MPAIDRFEDIEGWQVSRRLVNQIYEITKSSTFRADRTLSDQMRRAAISVMSNIAEGYESQSGKMFIRHLYIAKASTAELRSQLYICLDQSFISQDQFNQIYALTMDCSRLIGGFIRYLDRKQKS